MHGIHLRAGPRPDRNGATGNEHRGMAIRALHRGDGSGKCFADEAIKRGHAAVNGRPATSGATGRHAGER